MRSPELLVIKDAYLAHDLLCDEETIVHGAGYLASGTGAEYYIPPDVLARSRDIMVTRVTGFCLWWGLPWWKRVWKEWRQR